MFKVNAYEGDRWAGVLSPDGRCYIPGKAYFDSFDEACEAGTEMVLKGTKVDGFTVEGIGDFRAVQHPCQDCGAMDTYPLVEVGHPDIWECKDCGHPSHYPA